MLNYIYTGRVETNEAEVVKGIFLAANMLQMSDLEQLTVRNVKVKREKNRNGHLLLPGEQIGQAVHSHKLSRPLLLC